VFRAHDPLEGRLVAIKAFRLEITPEQAAEFAVELEDLAASQPRHPGMAAALAAGVQGTTPYLAQEYVAGEALDAALRQFGPPPSNETLTTLRRVAEALDRAAGDAIHHGTLHPRDILISDGGEARVIDLGVAQALMRSGLRVPVRRPYSAPERVAEGDWNGAADIYALGAIAFELVTGRRLAGPGRPDVSAPGISDQSAAALAEALARALDPDPAQRFPSATDLVDAIAPHLPASRRTSRRRAPEPSLPLPLDQFDPAETVALDAFRPEPATAPLVEVPDETIADEPVAAAPALVPEPPFTEAAEPARPRFVSLDVEPEVATSPTESAELDQAREEAAASAWASTFATAPTPPARRPFLPLVVALLVGVAAGFGWGYWTAFRTVTRPAATVADATIPAAAGPTASVQVEEPEVIGEKNLPSPAATAPGRAQSSPRATPPVAAASPAAPASKPPAAKPPAPAPPAERETPKQAPARASTPAGRLLVRSTPSGAQVRVDGRVRGKTPLVLRDMPLRVMRVSIEHSGFQPDLRRVALSAAQPTVTVEAKLTPNAPSTPEATTGSLLIESRPSGATIFVDGREIGATPLSLPGLSPGTRRIRLELAGFTPWVTTAEVQAGTRTRVAASLERGTQE
jgi:serine/threonine-protein kinase